MDHFKFYLRVRYAECDAQKVVFNARYSDYVDLATTEFLRAVAKRLDMLSSSTFEYQVVKQTTEWRASAYFYQVLELTVYAKHLGNTSFSLCVEFRIAGSDSIIATTETVYVRVDPVALTKLPLTADGRQALMEGAKGERVDHAGYFASIGVEAE